MIFQLVLSILSFLLVAGTMISGLSGAPVGELIGFATAAIVFAIFATSKN